MVTTRLKLNQLKGLVYIILFVILFAFSLVSKAQSPTAKETTVHAIPTTGND